MSREEYSSTAIGNGIAVPHGDSREVNKSCIAIGILNRPVDWSGERIDLVFLLALNVRDCNDLALISRELCSLFEDQATIAKIRSARSCQDVIQSLLG